MYQQKGKVAFNGKLDNILSLAVHLGHPERKFKSIHVAGTNGKGSSSHMLASILQEAGYKVGLYTSPHLKDFRERIKINGKPVSKKYVQGFIEKNRPYFENEKFSFFEMSVGMAFAYFALKKVDIAIIEVGLGGRLDSTNIITPEVSLITNIGWDHVDILGETLPKIALEKAGIIKKGIPVVISERQKEVEEVFVTMAKINGSKIVFAEDIVKKRYRTGLLGKYQIKNVKGVIAVLDQLKGFKITEEHKVKGLQRVVENTGLMGRWQVLRTRPKVICDTAHNAEGLALVMEQIKTEKFHKLHMVLGFVKDKKLDAILPLLPKNARYYFAKPSIDRGLKVDILQAEAKKHRLEGAAYALVSEALTAALESAGTEDFVYVGGSTFVVAEVV